MRVSNLLEFTENHRYFVSRDFTLGSLDRRLLASLYQPMAGAFAAGLYHFLYHLLADDATGSGRLEPQRGLFLGLGLEPNAGGRKTLRDAASMLEAVGLMNVYRHFNPATEEFVYEYVLQRPLGPAEFFASPHLTLLLRDKLGKPAVLELRTRLQPGPPSELAPFVGKEDLTVPFYELFRIDGGASDPDFEPSWEEAAPAREANRPPDKIRHADMLLRFPRGSRNRVHVERLGLSPEQMGQINYLAYKYDLDASEICRLLDEDGVFGADGALHWEALNRRAHLTYRQDRKRDEERERFLARGTSRQPVVGTAAGPASATALLDVPERFRERMTPEHYRDMLAREPYTRVLEMYFPGSVPDSFVRVFERIDLNYKLPEPVINVLIHYLFGMKHAQRLTQGFIDAIASNMLAKGVDTFDRAVVYVQEQAKLNDTLERRRRGDEPPATNGRGKHTQRRKPAMPVVEDAGASGEISPEEWEKMMDLARRLQGDT